MSSETRTTRQSPPILLVEDGPLILLSATEALEEAGFVVAPMREGAAAMRYLEEERCAALVTDIRLPGAVDGIQLALSARERRPELPVLYITGELREEEIPAVVPGSAVLRKPFTATMLAHAVRDIICADDEYPDHLARMPATDG